MPDVPCYALSNDLIIVESSEAFLMSVSMFHTEYDINYLCTIVAAGILFKDVTYEQMCNNERYRAMNNTRKYSKTVFTLLLAIVFDMGCSFT